MSSLTIAQTITDASQIYAIAIYSLILIGGFIGNIINIIVFGSLKIYRRNQCAFYLIITSIVDSLLLVTVLPLCIIEYVFDYDPTRLSPALCKVKQIIIATFSIISFSLICFAAIDQYLSTHYKPRLRQLSSLKLAHRLVYIAIIAWTLLGVPFLIFFEIQSTFRCSIYDEGLSRYYSLVHFYVLSGFLPITVATLAAVFAYLNVRHIIRHQVPVVRRRLDQQLTAMVLTKVAFLVVTTLPFLIFRIYQTNTSINSSYLVQIAIQQLLFAIASSLFYVNFAGTCSVFLLVSKRFRNQVKRVFVRNVWQKLLFIVRKNNTLHNHNQVAPASETINFELEYQNYRCH